MLYINYVWLSIWNVGEIELGQLTNLKYGKSLEVFEHEPSKSLELIVKTEYLSVQNSIWMWINSDIRNNFRKSCIQAQRIYVHPWIVTAKHQGEYNACSRCKYAFNFHIVLLSLSPFQRVSLCRRVAHKFPDYCYILHKFTASLEKLDPHRFTNMQIRINNKFITELLRYNVNRINAIPNNMHFNRKMHVENVFAR